MKTIQLSILLLLSPLIFFGQTLTGLWMGSVSNDSTTIRKDQSFEIVLTQYKDKVYGYSRSTFIVNDTLYYIVKRVTGTIENDICEVKDDDIISHNFPRKPEKGVKMISTFRRNQSDSTWHLDGDWKTTESKRHKYYSISGKINLQTESDLEKSKIFPHLEELNLADDVAFYKESKKKPELIAAIRQPAKDAVKAPSLKSESAIAVVSNIKKVDEVTILKKPEPIAASLPHEIKASNNVQNPNEERPVIATIKEEVRKAPAISEPVAINSSPVNDTKKQVIIKEEKPVIVAVAENKKPTIVATPAKSEPIVAVKQPVNNKQTEPILKSEKPVTTSAREIKKEEKLIPVKPEPQKTDPVATVKTLDQQKATVAKEIVPPVRTVAEVKPANSQAASLIAERTAAPSQTVFFKSDSLELSLYDNGEIDGDTVSVLLNGQIILAKQGLKASAIKKTIYIPAGSEDSLILVLYAENLGKYPPNTGLLVVHDGEDVYQIRFRADLQQNAAVIFKRKRN